jgi:class 3 adenylate cyclase/tetratricopeptide (TPR) repeat protein
VQLCSSCHHPNAPDARFCAGCGAELIPVTARREERKIITTLFADLVGFTSRAEQMDVEDVRAMLAPYHALVRQQLEQRNGTVEKFAGDAVMAVFGAPTAHEDDPERAVRAALAIREALAVSNERHPELDLHVRIGVNTGEALVSLDANPALGESIASGDVVNTAARLQTAAPIDGVVVGEVTYRATRDLIDYEELGAVDAKGKAIPIACWQALRARSSIGESRRRHDAAPLVGRRRELEELVEAFEHAKRSRSVQILTVAGVPGIGKSRLVRELFHELDRRVELIRWREGRSPPYGEGVTFWALGEIVKAEAGMRGAEDPETAASKLAAAVAAVIDDPDDGEWVERHLRALVGLEGEEILFGDRKAEAFAAWRQFIERLAQQRPTVLVLDDIHWADDALLDFIEHLVAWASDVQLLLLCTARPELFERRPGWQADSSTSRVVALGPLSEAETHELFDALLGMARLPDETRAALLTGAGGNPLYAEEFVRMLVDRELLVQRNGEWQLGEVVDLPVPDSVFGIIAARLDALPPEDKAVIQDAAVIGKAFWPAGVACTAGRGRWAIEEALRRLEQRQLIRRRHESSVAGQTEYIFEHALIRDVAYRTIIRPLRAEKHQRAAEWLSSLARGVADRADVIAHHYVTALENAEASGQAVPELRAAASKALEAAAERARSLHSHAGAAKLWRRALELSPGDGRRPRLLLGLGKALALADEPAAEILDDATGLLLKAGDRSGAAEAESTKAWLLSVAGKPEEARMRDRRALELVRGADPSGTKALILSSMGAHSVFVRELRDEALGLLEEALSIARALGLREIEAEALQFVGLTRLDAGDEEGVRDIENALSVATELNSPVALTCYGNLADVLRYLGALKASAARHLEGERAAKRFGIPVQVRRFRAEQACDLYYSGDWDDALGLVDEYLAAVESGSPHRGVGEARLHRGRIRLARGDVEGAFGDAEAALRFARTTEEPFNLFPALAFHARVSFERAPQQAETSIAELLDRLAAGQPFWGAWSLPQLVEVAGEERLSELKRVLARAMPPTRWYEAVSAAIDEDHARAAELYAAMGAEPDEAVARVRAAEQAVAAGEMSVAHDHLASALGFFTRVDANMYVQRCNGVTLGRANVVRGDPSAGL